MSRPRMRPRFELEVSSADARALLSEVSREAEADPRVCPGKMVGRRHIDLLVCAEDRHFFSPHLELEIAEPTEDGGIRVKGRFSPHPNVWTLFAAIYAVLGLVAVAGAMYGCAQIILGETPWGFAGVPGALGLAAFTYGAAFIGQGLGAEQMYVLRSVVDRAVEGVEGTRG